MGRYRNTSEIIKFVDAWIDNGQDHIEAMKVVSPDLEPKARQVKASRWIKSSDVMTCLLNRCKSLNVTQDKLRNMFHNVLVAILTDTSEKSVDRMKAIELIAKIENMLKDHIQVDTKTIDKQDQDLYDRYVGRVSTKGTELPTTPQPLWTKPYTLSLPKDTN